MTFAEALAAVFAIASDRHDRVALEVSTWGPDPLFVKWNVWSANDNRHYQAETAERVIALYRASLAPEVIARREVASVGVIKNEGDGAS